MLQRLATADRQRCRDCKGSARVWVTVVAVLCLLVVGGTGLLISWRFERLPAALARSGELVVGMDQAEVQRLLGNPRYRDREKGSGWEDWIYHEVGALPALHVYFDPNGRLTRWHLDR